MTKPKRPAKKKIAQWRKVPKEKEPLLSIVPTKADDPAITMKAYGALEAAFNFLNARLFDGALANVVIVLQRRAHSGGHFGPDRFTRRTVERREHEISLNPDGFVGQTDEYIVAIPLHEMTHEWQVVLGKPSPRGYHNKGWGAKIKSLGLMPSSTGMVGGKETGQRMSHYVIPGGAYQQAFAELAATGWKLNLQSTIVAAGTKAPRSKVKFTCPGCGSNMWGKPGSKDISGECHQWRKGAKVDVAAVASYEQAAA